MRQISVVALLLTFLLASLALPQSTASKKKTKTAAAKSTAKKGKASSKTARHTAPVAYRQNAPTPERYKEIQQALEDKGYLKSEPNGVWDADSAAALAKFQSDRNLMPTGKLNSASLIALGLGPSTAPIPEEPNAHAAAEDAPTPAASSNAAPAPSN